MSKEKLTANVLTFACPDQLRSAVSDFRYTSRIPSEGEAIRRLIVDGLAAQELKRQTEAV